MQITKIHQKVRVDFKDKRRIWITNNADKMLEDHLSTEQILDFLRSLHLPMINVGTHYMAIRVKLGRLCIEVIPLTVED